MKDAKREEQFQRTKERRVSKNVNFQTNLDTAQKKITSPQFQSNELQGFSSQATKSPLINHKCSIKSFKEDSIVRNQDKNNKEQYQRKPSLNNNAIEMTFLKTQPLGFTQCVKQIEDQKKKFTNFNNLELVTQNDEIFSYQKQNQLTEVNNTEQGVPEEENKCRFCSKNMLDKERTLNTDKEVEDEEEEEEKEDQEEENQQNAEGKEYAPEQDEEKGTKQKEKQIKEKPKQYDINELVLVCKCAKKCYTHRKCLLTYSFNKKHKCRVCNVQASFQTRRNYSYKSLKQNYQTKRKEVNSIFSLFVINILIFISFLSYYIYYSIHNSNKLIIWSLILFTLSMQVIYGLFFFINKFSKLCIIEISSEITLEDIVLKKKENGDSKSEAYQYSKINNNLNTLNEECLTQQQQQDKFDKFSYMDQFQLTQAKMISPKHNLKYRKSSSFASNSNTISNQQNQFYLQNAFLNRDQNRKQSEKFLPYKKTLFTEDSEQSPHDQKVFQNQMRLIQKPNLMLKNNNSSPSNSKNVSSDNTKPNSILSFKRKMNQNILSEKNQIKDFSNNNQFERNPDNVQQEPVNKLIKLSVQQVLSTNNNDSPLTNKNIQGAQQCESIKKGEQTSRFGCQHMSSQRRKSENQNLKHLNLKINPNNLQKYQTVFKEIDNIHEESQNCSSINTSKTQNKTDPKETNDRSSAVDQSPETYTDIENQPSKNPEISDENRKSNEEIIKQEIKV